MNSPLVLVLLCGLCLTALGLADAVHGIHTIPDKVSHDIQKLTQHFNVTADISLFGNPIFLQNMNSDGKFEDSEQMLVLQESLDVYITILTDMLNSTQDKEIQTSITAIRARMEDLMNYFLSRQKALLERLQKLRDLETSDATVQRKAVRELRPVLQKAFELCGKNEHRRRRHASLAQLQRR
ncbi:interferon gamma 1-like [Anguilla anguilla]|uniref:interferon gamma 1-like n=1 Tax=Anguilla anguilla TaxID=7936 RepID=UPI0015A9F5B4|nr:interferon gamma 1-like [Anguilla anguilla]